MSNYVNLLDIIYPVGSVYITFSSVSPASSIGGTWEKINNAYLYCTTSGGTYTGSNTGSLNLDHNHYMSLWFPNIDLNLNRTGLGFHIGDAAIPRDSILTGPSSAVSGTHWGADGKQHVAQPLGLVHYDKQPRSITCFGYRRTA